MLEINVFYTFSIETYLSICTQIRFFDFWEDKYMKNYRIKLNEYQMNIFNKQDFNGDKQCKLQSLLAYIIKHSIDNTLTKSTNKLYAMYIRHHRSISLSYFNGGILLVFP